MPPAEPPDPIGSIDVSAEAWQPFAPREVASILDGIDVPWYVAGGWALDLFCGEVTRAHGDIEILLFKAKATRDKDELDFAAIVPRLSPAQRAWLVSALDRAHPGQPWLARL